MAKITSNTKRVAMLIFFLISAAANCLAKATISYENDSSNDFNYYNPLIQQTGDTLKVGMVLEGVNTAKAGRITLSYKYDSSIKKAMPMSKRLIVVNGKAMEPGTIGGLEGSDYMIILTPEQGVKKYGKKGEFCVIEANGPKITLLSVPSPPPSGPPPSYQ
ncbi:hypothetical protein [Pedobacter agri]|uniref:hypothetical protein n=1 Tax=Pedobacter agri TaxID=454586 RepID=UPI0029308C6A|nr:hypothetical protein [Pedobacter agri]